MESYTEMKNRQQKDFANFPCFFAFNTDQFEKGLKKLGLEQDEMDKLYKGPCGMFYRRSDSKRLHDLLKSACEEMARALKDNDFFRSAIQHELDNHEYCITLDPEPALAALDLSAENLSSEQIEIMNEIKQQY